MNDRAKMVHRSTENANNVTFKILGSTGKPHYFDPTIDVPRDYAWNQKKIQRALTSGIIQGKSTPKITKDFMKVMGNNQAAAIRNARTACTSAQNAGTLDSMRYAQSMGVEIRKKWLATLDGRTRDSHGSLDGECVGLEETFSNGLRFPGDPDGSPGEVYNCRCTMENYYPGISDKLSKGNRRMRDPETGENEVAENITYTEWVKKKESENPDAWNLYTKKIRNLSADKKQYHEYRSVLGNKAPKSIDEFQNLKYTKIDEWSALKIAKRQTVFVENAPCITTPKKFTEYFLKEGAKHASQFFDVGYTSDNPLQLRYDIARQFEAHKATSTIDERGKERLVLYMYLGVDKKKRFKTVWIKDNENAKPRILTAYRKGE